MKRPVLATLHRKGERVWRRTYARIETAIRRGCELAVTNGRPGDVVEYADDRTGVQLGTVKVHAGGSLTATWTIHRQGLASLD